MLWRFTRPFLLSITKRNSEITSASFTISWWYCTFFLLQLGILIRKNHDSLKVRQKELICHGLHLVRWSFVSYSLVLIFPVQNQGGSLFYPLSLADPMQEDFFLFFFLLDNTVYEWNFVIYTANLVKFRKSIMLNKSQHHSKTILKYRRFKAFKWRKNAETELVTKQNRLQESDYKLVLYSSSQQL